MKLRWLIPIAVLLPMRLHASDPTVGARVTTVTINPGEVTLLHLRPEFESTIRMPEEITSVIVGSPATFKAEHSEAEPNFVYIKPIKKEPAQSNLLIATKSGQHVTLELISGGTGMSTGADPVDFLIEYRMSRSFLVSSDPVPSVLPKLAEHERGIGRAEEPDGSGSASLSSLDEEFVQQKLINAPQWTKWEKQAIETSIGDVRQWSTETVISYSVYNDSTQPVEIVPPQIQMTGHKATKKKKKKDGRGIIADQLEIRDYRLSTTRLEPGDRADGVVAFDRPNFKQSTEKLFLQLAQANQVDQPILIRLPFTPPISTSH